MVEDFHAAVEDGLRLCKRIYLGSDKTVAPPRPLPAMERSAGYSYLPTSPMMYAVITNPAMVDNPDMPSYQPYVHGKLDPPALLPLQMNRISLEVDCCMDTAFVTVHGSWRVHCIMGSRSCDCLIAVPMGEQGSIQGVEVELPMRSYHTRLVEIDNEIGIRKGKAKENDVKIEDEPFVKPQIFTITIPKIGGGTNVSVKLRWSQKLIYQNGRFTLKIPYSFPQYVVPAVKKLAKHERIQINVQSALGTQISCETSSFPMKEQRKETGNRSFLYEADVLSWSENDFVFSYALSSEDTFGTVLLNPPLSHDTESGDRFCCYLFPGKKQLTKVFRREVVFVVDISGSMKGKLLEDTKNAIFTALAKLGPEDSFNIIAFNSETRVFSSSLSPAAAENTEKATQWINLNFVAGGETNLLIPLNQAIEMFSGCNNCMPVLLLTTDGAVENERQICDMMKDRLTDKKNVLPRIYTVGIGKFCNHYFLRKLALLGGGHHEVATDVDPLQERMERQFERALSIFLADICFENLHAEVLPCRIPDLSSGGPLIVSGRYRGKFPDTLKVKGTLSNMSNIIIDLNVVQDAKDDMTTGKVIATQEIELLTAEAWHSDSKVLREKVKDMSVDNGIASEYTNMIMFETTKRKTKSDTTNAAKKQKVSSKVVDSHMAAGEAAPKPERRIVVRNIRHGFGNTSATEDNIPPEHSNCGEYTDDDDSRCCCCMNHCTNCCGMTCLAMCSRMNDQCATALTQFFTALACVGCYSWCCSESCCCAQGE